MYQSVNKYGQVASWVKAIAKEPGQLLMARG